MIGFGKKASFSRYVESVFAKLDALGIEIEGYVSGRLYVSVPETTNVMTGGVNLAGDMLAEAFRSYMEERGYRSDFISARVRKGDVVVLTAAPASGSIFGISDVWLLKEAV